MLYIDFLETVTTCPFCNQVNKVIVENETAFLTYALAPYHAHHLLVIPKRHVETFDAMTSQENEDIEKLQKKGLEILEKLGYTNISLLEREGAQDNKSVKHIHFHIIPDIHVGNLDHDETLRQILTEAQIDQVMADIKKVI